MGFEPIGNNIPLKDFFKNQNCECGYAPHEIIDKQILRLMKKNRKVYADNIEEIKENLSREETCSARYSLNNHICFPPVSIMSSCDETKDIYYDTESGMPKVHWALVIEINHLLRHPSRVGFGGFNAYGDEIHVYFEIEENEKPVTFAWEDLKDGNTVVILYAEQKKFKNGDSLVVETNLDSCFVFKESLELIKHEAHMLLLDTDLMSKNEPSCCFSCGYSNSSQILVRCANCKLAKYCSKECQSYSWKESHKRLCEQNEILLRLSALPLQPFIDFFTFNNNDKMFLPQYRPSSQKKKMHLNYEDLNNKENENIEMITEILEKKVFITDNVKNRSNKFSNGMKVDEFDPDDEARPLISARENKPTIE